MALSAKQIAIFGQVRVNIMAFNCTIASYATLLDLYRDGWWVTERFGTLITLVKPRSHDKDGFACVVKRIQTSINLDSLDEQIKLFADKQYEKYRYRLEEDRTKLRLKKWKVTDGNDLSGTTNLKTRKTGS